jgi:hypothetical protein
MVAIEPSHAQIGLWSATDADHRSGYRAPANVRATALRHSARYDSASAAHGYAFYRRAARESGRPAKIHRPAERGYREDQYRLDQYR